MMRFKTFSTAVLGSLCLGALVIPAFSKDDPVKEKLQAIQQRMQQNQQGGGNKPGGLKPGNNDFGRQIQQVQKQNLNQNQPKLFNPPANKGLAIAAVTGTLRNFSGGSLNWTIEARCTDDLVCDASGCESEIKPPNEACVSLRPTDEDNDEGTN